MDFFSSISELDQAKRIINRISTNQNVFPSNWNGRTIILYFSNSITCKISQVYYFFKTWKGDVNSQTLFELNKHLKKMELLREKAGEDEFNQRTKMIEDLFELSVNIRQISSNSNTTKTNNLDEIQLQLYEQIRNAIEKNLKRIKELQNQSTENKPAEFEAFSTLDEPIDIVDELNKFLKNLESSIEAGEDELNQRTKMREDLVELSNFISQISSNSKRKEDITLMLKQIENAVESNQRKLAELQNQSAEKESVEIEESEFTTLGATNNTEESEFDLLEALGELENEVKEILKKVDEFDPTNTLVSSINERKQLSEELTLLYRAAKKIGELLRRINSEHGYLNKVSILIKSIDEKLLLIRN